MINGIINVHKEAGYTSHDVVGKLRGILHQKKIGHTGTLDPDAEGVLPVCLGNATKLCDMLVNKEKTYEVRFRLGITTDTQDMSGTVTEERPVFVTPEEAGAAVMEFVGAYDQIPPMYSAKKVDGKKLYELAREGKVVERKPCHVTIHSIVIKDMALPYIEMEVCCSKGTYIRTLCHDIGRKLSCGAAMETLKRTKSGKFDIENSVSLAQIEALAKEGRIGDILIPVEEMLDEYPKLTVRKEAEKLLYNGNALPCGSFSDVPEADKSASGVRIYAPNGDFTAIYRYNKEDERFVPVKMFRTES